MIGERPDRLKSARQKAAMARRYQDVDAYQEAMRHVNAVILERAIKDATTGPHAITADEALRLRGMLVTDSELL